MIYISKFRSNDLNPSKGKQIEFNKVVVDKFFNFTESEHFVDFECHSILNTNLKEDIHVEFKLSPSRGDYKIYQNNDGSKDLKDFFLETLHLENDKNLDDYFAIKKEAPTKYILYYVPKDLVFSNFFSIASGDQILFTPEESEESEETKQVISESHQTIYYGAPGTGKSHTIKKILGEYEGCPEDKIVPKENIFRTTFHPDSDYSTFVGAYKPTMKKQYRYEGKVKASYYEDDDLAGAKKGDPIIEKAIEYSFIPQAFLNAYIRAYQTKENVYLIIEEINRGNCAQIFGDLFQLLDRDAKGVSEYPIKADADLKVFLEEELGEDNPGIKDGELCLPSNLYIYATMNTSDQSLFPIDSAFKRRWDWKYVPIAKGNDNGVELNWMIEVGDNKYDWWTFVKTINKHVFETTNSEDKQLGFFFCKAKDNIICADTFVCKVVFYLWNDVFKDFGFDNSIFADKADGTNPKLSFDKFYMANGKVNDEKTKMFLANLGMVPLFDSNDKIDIFLDEEGNTKETVDKDFSKYSINGVGTLSKGKVVQQAVEKYANEHPDMNADQIVDQWMGLKVNIPNFIESEATYEGRVSRSKDSRVREKSKSVTLPNGDIIYVSNQYNTIRIEDLISKVNATDWGIKIEKA